MFVAEHFLSGIIQEYRKHSVSIDDGGGTWYPIQACRFLIKTSYPFPLGEKLDRKRTIHNTLRIG